jgi:hypothetical protein
MMQERIDVRLERAFWNALEAAVQPKMLADWVSGSLLRGMKGFLTRHGRINSVELRAYTEVRPAGISCE